MRPRNWISQLWIPISVVFCILPADSKCPYDFSASSRIISASCHKNRTVSGNENCCWYAQAAFVYAISEYANRTGNVLLSSSDAALCVNQFITYVDSNGLANRNLLKGGSSCSFSADTYTSVNGTCKYAKVREVRGDVDLTSASATCDGPDLRATSACGRCQSTVTAATFVLVREKSANDIFGCGTAVTVGIWASNPDMARYVNYFLCVIKVLQNLGGLSSPAASPSLSADSSFPPNNPNFSSHGSNPPSHRNRKRVLVAVGGGLACAAVILCVGAAITRTVGFRSFEWPVITVPGTGSSGGRALTRSLMGTTSTPTDLPTEGLYIFTIRELRKATDGFSSNRVLGSGGSCTVYLGRLPSGKTVAVKRITHARKLDQFYQEVELLSRLRHPNLTSLLGYCQHKSEHILVYEFMPGGDLAKALLGAESSLSWRQRLQIAVDCAEGLSYLHSFPEGAIIHRDIKPTNILLSESGQAKLADFGVSKLIAAERTHVSTEVKGTTGYLDPEYFSLGQLTEASDVYSFGVVLLQLLSGQKAVVTTPSGGADSIVYLAHVLMGTGTSAGRDVELSRIVDPRLPEAMAVDGRNIESMKVVLAVAYRCVQPFRHERPSIGDVRAELRVAWGMCGGDSREPAMSQGN